MEISCDNNHMDIGLIHRFLSEESLWAKGIPLATLEKSIKHSLCFGDYIESKQIAFARVVTDDATFANLVDVFVLPDYRGNGFGKKLSKPLFHIPNYRT